MLLYALCFQYKAIIHHHPKIDTWLQNLDGSIEMKRNDGRQ